MTVKSMPKQGRKEANNRLFLTELVPLPEIFSFRNIHTALLLISFYQPKNFIYILLGAKMP